MVDNAGQNDWNSNNDKILAHCVKVMRVKRQIASKHIIQKMVANEPKKHDWNILEGWIYDFLNSHKLLFIASWRSTRSGKRIKVKALPG